ncbi:hypothetical protein [Caldalkalibacillus salinus]|uniref:hypothetical protein n=1 Tax=Caldalkalibacillus salinus TaxID=2803787 RepID=UPI0019218670|nr:hypothetical protein [Caldalkalibacillus salinus]
MKLITSFGALFITLLVLQGCVSVNTLDQPNVPEIFTYELDTIQPEHEEEVHEWLQEVQDEDRGGEVHQYSIDHYEYVYGVGYEDVQVRYILEDQHSAGSLDVQLVNGNEEKEMLLQLAYNDTLCCEDISYSIGDGSQQAEMEQVAKTNVITEEQVLRDAHYFFDLIKEKEVSTLSRLWLSEHGTEQFDRQTVEDKMAKSVALYHQMIDFSEPVYVELGQFTEGQTIVGVRLENASNDQQQKHEDLVLTYTDGKVSYSSDLFSFYPEADVALNEYVATLKQQSVERLIWLLYPGNAVKEEQVKAGLNRYLEGYELETLEASIIDYTPEDHFIAVIEDDTQAFHETNIVYKDGHFSIEDPFMKSDSD